MWVKSPDGKVEEHTRENGADLVRNAGWVEVPAAKKSKDNSGDKSEPKEKTEEKGEEEKPVAKVVKHKRAKRAFKDD
jgi:hypothetical protein